MIHRSIPIVLKNLSKDYVHQWVVTVPLILFNQLENSLTCHIKVGSFSQQVICLPNFTSQSIELSSAFFNQFSFLNDTQCHGRVKDNVIHLGPVIGVFSSNGSIRRANEQEANFRTFELAKANSDVQTILYFFSVKDVNFIENKINGTYWNQESESWEKAYFPLPDLLYDRGGGTLKNQQVVSKFIRSQLEKIELKKFNPQHYFDKWDVYEKLKKFPHLLPHLPLTMKYQGIDTFKEMFQQSSILFLKDCYGSNGRGILRVVKLPNGSFSYSYFDEVTKEGRFYDLSDLVRFTERFYKGKKYILQNAIHLIRLNQSAIDLRATVQRNGKNEIEISPYPVRVGSGKSPVTSTKSGSTVYQFKSFFEEYFSYSEDELTKLDRQIENFLLDFFHAIELSYGTFGEVGIDFAIDVNGHLWFIECNAKPGKDAMYLAYDENVIRQAFYNPLSYGKYVTGF